MLQTKSIIIIWTSRQMLKLVNNIHQTSLRMRPRLQPREILEIFKRLWIMTKNYPQMPRKLKPKLKQTTLRKLMKVEVSIIRKLLILTFLMHGPLVLNLLTISTPKDHLIELRELRGHKKSNGNPCKKKIRKNKMPLMRLRKLKSRKSLSSKKEKKRRKLKPSRLKLKTISRLLQKLEMLMRILRISTLILPRIRKLYQRLTMKKLLLFQ